MNKSWNAEARNLLSARRNTVARIGGRVWPLSSWSNDLVKFAKTLKGMSGIPFYAGINFFTSQRRGCSACDIRHYFPSLFQDHDQVYAMFVVFV